MNLEIITVANYDQMSMIAAHMVIRQIEEKPNSVLGLTTGPTPLGMYQILINDFQSNGTSYREAFTVNLDEYVGLDVDHPNSNHVYMRKNFFNHIDIHLQNTHLLNGLASDWSAETTNYEQMIKQLGGLDLQILEIGRNGQIGFNETGSSFTSRAHVTTLTENARQIHAYFFPDSTEVPKKAMTLGMGTILESEEIILLASGSSKAKAMKRLVQGDISEEFPASALRLHHNTTVIADQAALQLL